MKCPHCAVVIHSEAKQFEIGKDTDGLWNLEMHKCPNCDRWILYLEKLELTPRVGQAGSVYKVTEQILIHPKGAYRPIPSQVPEEFAQDFKEACLVLNDSPKASAALSRRCLQNLIWEKAGIKKRNLYEEIEELINSGNLPSYIVEELHIIRGFGNIAAHPLKNEITGDVLPVEPEEAEWLLIMLERLFDFYFVHLK